MLSIIVNNYTMCSDQCLLTKELEEIHKELKEREQEAAQNSDELHNSKEIVEGYKVQIQTLTEEIFDATKMQAYLASLFNWFKRREQEIVRDDMISLRDLQEEIDKAEKEIQEIRSDIVQLEKENENRS